MDFYFIGELNYMGKDCQGAIYDDHMHLMNSQEMSQVVIGESAFSCMLN